MARIIKYENSIGWKLDGKRDPARYETQSETIRRLKCMIRTIGLMIANIQERWAKNQATSSKIMDLSARKHKLEQDLKSYED